MGDILKDHRLDLLKVYNLLYNTYGPQGWWPAKSKFEIIIGAILTQQAKWENVERAIENLKRERILSPKKLAKARINKIEKAIRCVPFYKTKAKRIKNIARSYKTLIKKVKEGDRDYLLKTDGIGEETADSILLYVGGKRFFVVDAYTKRILKRIANFDGNYESIRRFFEEKLPRDVKIYKEYHALIVKHCKEICKSKPLCNKCVLNKMCNHARLQRND